MTEYPVHKKLTVHSGKDIYKKGDWWKAALKCSYGSREPGVSVYLWNRGDGDWKRKNKYRVPDVNSWRIDKSIIEEFLEEQPSEASDIDNKLPVSDYYNVSRSKTIFRQDGWWKAIVSINQKGDYNLNSEEVMIYLWQDNGEEWKRRQKYAIKNLDDWQNEKHIVEDLFETEYDKREDKSIDDLELDSVESLMKDIKENIPK
jgi:hypothetical protein